MVTASVLFFCSLAGFAFAKLRFQGSNALMVIVILTLTVPNQLGIVALYIVMGNARRGGWNGTLLAVIVPGLVTAFGVFYMRQFILDAVPGRAGRVGPGRRRHHHADLLEHRAAGDPARRWPCSACSPSSATWNDFQWPLITLGGTDYPTSMVALSDLASGNYVLYRRVLAGAFVATVPLLVMLFVGGRQIVRGIMEGAVKS